VRRTPGGWGSRPKRLNRLRVSGVPSCDVRRGAYALSDDLCRTRTRRRAVCAAHPSRAPHASGAGGEPPCRPDLAGVDAVRPQLRGVRGRRDLQALAGQDGDRVRRPPVLPAHDEPPPAAPGRQLRGETTQFRARTSSWATTCTRCCSACRSRTSPGKAIANLEIESLRHVAPTFHGDTLYGETTVLDKWESKSKDDRGVVHVETIGYNQDGKVVCIFRRKVMVPKESYLEERGGEQPGRPVPQPDKNWPGPRHADRPAHPLQRQRRHRAPPRSWRRPRGPASTSSRSPTTTPWVVGTRRPRRPAPRDRARPWHRDLVSPRRSQHPPARATSHPDDPT
jgi:hypothetical protein